MIDNLIARLRDAAAGDHARGCDGRFCSCDCGYDLTVEGLLDVAADEIERLQAALNAKEA